MCTFDRQSIFTANSSTSQVRTTRVAKKKNQKVSKLKLASLSLKSQKKVLGNDYKIVIKTRSCIRNRISLVLFLIVTTRTREPEPLLRTSGSEGDGLIVWHKSWCDDNYNTIMHTSADRAKHYDHLSFHHCYLLPKFWLIVRKRCSCEDSHTLQMSISKLYNFLKYRYEGNSAVPHELAKCYNFPSSCVLLISTIDFRAGQYVKNINDNFFGQFWFPKLR